MIEKEPIKTEIDDEDIRGRDFCETCINNKYFPVQKPCVNCIGNRDGVLCVTGTKYKKETAKPMIAVIVKMDVIGKIGEIVYVCSDIYEAFNWRTKHENELKLNEQYDIYYGPKLEVK